MSDYEIKIWVAVDGVAVEDFDDEDYDRLIDEVDAFARKLKVYAEQVKPAGVDIAVELDGLEVE